MKKVFLILTSVVMLASCEQPYIQIIETKSTNTKIENDLYVYENEMLKITYEFWHDRGLMSFSVFNKLETPIYIDWSKSAVINNSAKLNYWFDESCFTSNTYYGTHYYSGPVVAPGYSISEKVGVSNSALSQKYEKVSFIPPKSTYYRSQFHFWDNTFISFDQSKAEDVLCNEDGGKKKNTRVYSIEFDRNNSPLVFRNYLAVSKSEKGEDVTYIDNEFYITSAKAMYIGHALGKHIMKKNNGYHLFEQPYRKKTSFYILEYDIMRVEGLYHDRN